jgi:cytochrome c peroxidase
MRRAYFAIALTSFASWGCGGDAPSSDRVSAPDGGALGADGGLGGDAGLGGDVTNAVPPFTEDELAVLGTLSPASLPTPPVDVSNRFADDAAAAAFGQALFFETAFSGALLDGDDDGSSTTLGVKGQPGKVACAGCHVPTAGFLDNRTLGNQISLAAGWGKRRAPSLLDVGQAKLVMWDGRHDALCNQPFGPLENLVEMNSSRLYAAEQVFALYRADYEAIFGAMPPFDDVTRFPPIGLSALDGRSGAHVQRNRAWATG